jgi:hypothetical protein
MTSPAITTIVKMVESLPDDLQERVAEHIREFISDLEDEKRWDASFERTQDNLVAAARQARQEIAAGQSIPMDGLGNVWDVLEALTGTIKAPADWSAEHDHYLYGTPKRQEA